MIRRAWMRWLYWSGFSRTLILMLLLASLMALDVWISWDVLNQTSPTHYEGNPVALILGGPRLLAVKLVVTGLLGLYCLERRRTSPLVIANIVMGLVITWNIVALTLF